MPRVFQTLAMTGEGLQYQVCHCEDHEERGDVVGLRHKRPQALYSEQPPQAALSESLKRNSGANTTINVCVSDLLQSPAQKQA